MAISAGMIWEVRTVGADTNGGGFRGGANVSTPGAPTLAHSGTGGTVAANTYYVVVSLNDGNGATPKSAETAVTTTGTTSTITVTDPTTVSTETFAVYVGTTSGGPYFQQSTGNASGANKVITATPPTSGTQAPGVDYSQQNAAQVVIDNATITATTTGANSNTLTFTAGYTPTSADVGNTVRLTAGTNINVGTYEITGWTSTTWTLTGAQNATTAGGAGSAITGNMGGAAASPGMVSGVAVGGNVIYLKYNASAYQATTNSTNVSGGKMSMAAGVALIGFDTTRTLYNTDANRPTFQATTSGGNTMLVLGGGAAGCMVRNLIIDGNGQTSVSGFGNGGNNSSTFQRCKALSCATGFSFSNNSQTIIEDCWAQSCTTIGFGCNTAVLVRCVAISSVIGFAICYACIDCIAIGCTTAGFQTTVNYQVNCVAYNCGVGFDFSNGHGMLSNCIAYGSTTLNYKTVNSQGSRMFYCAGGGAGTANYDSTISPAKIIGFIALTVDPFNNGAGNDFSLNGTGGGGAACKAAGLPGSTAATQLTALSTLAYPDLGAAQSQGAGGPVVGQQLIKTVGAYY